MSGTFGKLFGFLMPGLTGKIPLSGGGPRGKTKRERLRDTLADEKDRLSKKQAVEDLLADARDFRQKMEEQRRAIGSEFSHQRQFLVEGRELVNGRDFVSSNVEKVWYWFAKEELYVQFQNGASYVYRNVNDVEALSAFLSTSKGIWVWDNLRVRGTKLGHRKAYAKVRGDFTERVWEGVTPQKMQQVAAQSGGVPAGEFKNVGKFMPPGPPKTNKARPKFYPTAKVAPPE